MQLNKNLKNIISLFSVEFASRLIGFIAITYLARVLDNSGFGVINIGLALLSYAMILSTSGLNLYATRALINDKEKQASLTCNIVLTRLFLTIIIFFIFTFFAYFIIEKAVIFETIFYYLLYLFPAVFIIEWFFHGYQRLDIISAGRIIGMILYLILLLVLVSNTKDIVVTGIAYTLGGVANSLFLLFIFHKSKYSIRFSFNSHVLVKLLKNSFPLGTAGVISQLVAMAPVVYLGIVASTTEVGLYSAAYKLIVLILVFDRIFSSLFFPKITYLIRNNLENLPQVFDKIVKIIAITALTVALLSILLSQPVIKIIFGESYSTAVPIFQILIAVFYLSILSSISTHILIAMNKDKIYTFSLLIGLVFFIIGLIILTYLYGSLGSAAAYVLFQITAMLVMFYKLKQILYINYLRSVLLPIFLLFLAIILKFIFFYDSLIIVELMVFILILFLSFLILGISKSELEYIKGLLF